MREFDDSLALRPLGIGEIFDRAVTLYVRNFAVVTAIAALVVVPMGVAGYFATAKQSTFAQILAQIQHPGSVPTAAPVPVWYFAVIAAGLVLTPFMYVAMASAIGTLYGKRRPEWHAAYAVAFRHAGAILATVFASIVLYLGAVICAALFLGILAGLSAVALAYVKPVGILLVIVVIVLTIAFVLAVMLGYLAMALAFESIGIERLSSLRAVGSGFARIFNRSEIGRALLVCLAFAAVQIGLLLVSAMVSALLTQLAHQTGIATVVQSALSLISSGFTGVLIAVYYFDVRVRRDGLDMHAAIDAMEMQLQA